MKGDQIDPPLPPEKTSKRPALSGLILANRKYPFKNLCSIKTGLSDLHNLIYSVMETTFKSQEAKTLIFHEYSNFSSECF